MLEKVMALTQSYTHGTSSVPLIGETIGNCFHRCAKRWADNEALVVPFQNIRWTYSQLSEKVDRVASGLLALGLKPGDRVGIWSPNNAEWVITQFATARAGLILVNLNPAYRVSELEYALNKVSCKALITATHFKSSDYLAMLAQIAPEFVDQSSPHLRLQKLSHLSLIITISEDEHAGCLRFKDLAELGGEKEQQQIASLQSELQFDDPINIQFTSGTTGLPKGATLTHHNIINNGYFSGQVLGYSEKDRVCIPVPLYHCFGMVLGNLSCITHGATMVFPGEAFEPVAVLKTVQQEKCTSLYGVPTMFIAMLDHPGFSQYDLKSLRTGIMAGSPCPIEVMKRCITDMHMSEVTIAYGMTETSPVSFQTAADDELERRVSTIGRALAHIEAKVIDVEGRIVSPGESGELCVRGYSVMLGYWDDKTKTNEAIDDAGWMHTGDLARIDKDGYCNIVGRIKDMLIRGGENVYPREIEEFLYQHPAIADVQVVGIADAKFGEEICACVKLRDDVECDAESIINFCQGKIAHYKVPRYIQFVDDFPMTVTGKVQKFKLREDMQNLLQG
jgi:fatty-acyl-CoA synthase